MLQECYKHSRLIPLSNDSCSTKSNQTQSRVNGAPSTSQCFSQSCLQCRCCCSSCCGTGLLQPRLGYIYVLSLPSGCNPRRNPHRLASASSCQSNPPPHHCDLPGHQCSSCCLWFCHGDRLPAHSRNLPHKGAHLAAEVMLLFAPCRHTNQLSSAVDSVVKIVAAIMLLGGLQCCCLLVLQTCT